MEKAKHTRTHTQSCYSSAGVQCEIPKERNTAAGCTLAKIAQQNCDFFGLLIRIDLRSLQKALLFMKFQCLLYYELSIELWFSVLEEEKILQNLDKNVILTIVYCWLLWGLCPTAVLDVVLPDSIRWNILV